MTSAFAVAQAVPGGPLPGPNPLFPADNWWNVDVTSAPVDLKSAALIAHIGGTRALHPDFGGDAGPTAIYGMVYITVPGTQPLVEMTFDYPTESDYGAPGRPLGYPIPNQAKTLPHWIEGGYPGNCDRTLPTPQTSPCAGDNHMLIVDTDNRLLFETFNTRCLPADDANCTWSAGSGAIFSLDSNARRPDTWTSADAAGLAILPGLVRYDEAYGASPIKHAFRFTVQNSFDYVYPGSHDAGSTVGALPMGTRMRLKPGVTVASADAGVQRIVQAMKTYGLIVADNGSNMYIQGTYDTRWDNGLLNPAFGALHASDFEVIQLGWRPPLGPLQLKTLTPCRLLDTRLAAGNLGGPALANGVERTFSVAGQCGIPPGARAISANVTAVNASTAGLIRLFATHSGPSAASAVSFAAGKSRANNAIIWLSPEQGLTALFEGASGSTHLIIDVNGAFP
ncbi:MAG: hypothetical protein ABIT01_16360 [Thermoanaerobaculia bacterium]